MRPLLLLIPSLVALAADPATAAATAGEDGEPWGPGRLQSYEPMYFLLGRRDELNAKFQISLKYRLYKPLHVSYSQTSLWDLESESKPFYDTAYKPRLWLGEDRLLAPGWCSRLGGEAGIGHESNGKSGADSRSINIAFVRPRARWGEESGWHLDLDPVTYVYLEKSDNPDIARYRGYCDLTASVAGPHGMQCGVTARKGATSDWSVGSLQADVSYDLGRLWGSRGGPFVQLQGFTGYGESIIDYDRHVDSQLRLGLALVR